MLGGAFLALFKHRAQIFCYCGALFATSSRPLGLRSRLMTSGLADGASDGDLYLASEVQSNVANAREPLLSLTVRLPAIGGDQGFCLWRFRASACRGALPPPSLLLNKILQP